MLDAMGMMINRRRVMGGKALPYDAEIEYLESTGTQYIELPVNVSSNLISDINCTIDDPNGNDVLLWNRYQTTNPQYAYSIVLNVPYESYSIRVDYGSSNSNGGYQNYITSIKNFIGNAHIVFGKGKIIFNDRVFILKNSSQTFTSPLNNYTTGVNAIKLKSLSIIDNDTTIFNLIPVRVGNVGYMYDKVSSQLFGNAGTGSFILGPDK